MNGSKGSELLWAIHIFMIKNQIIEEVRTFQYLGSTISKQGNMYLESNINSFNKLNG